MSGKLEKKWWKDYHGQFEKVTWKNFPIDFVESTTEFDQEKITINGKFVLQKRTRNDVWGNQWQIVVYGKHFTKKERSKNNNRWNRTNIYLTTEQLLTLYNKITIALLENCSKRGELNGSE